MKQNWWKPLVAVALVLAVGVALTAKNRTSDENSVTLAESSLATPLAETEAEMVQPEPEIILDDAGKAFDASAEARAVKAEANINTQKKNEEMKAAVVADKPRSTAKGLPKMIELGADQCIPCRMMKPILEELERDYKGKLEIVFIDVWKDRAAGEKYRIQSIPTQVFIDENGEEFFRHVGFFPKEDILKTFRDHGIKLD